MIHKKISDITSQDILDLISQGREESGTMDFKEQYDISGDWKKAEFLADISSFANTSGWDIVFWIREEEWKAVAASPFPISNPDAEILAMESLVRDWLEPRVKIEPKFVPHETWFFLIVRIAKSWVPPHRVVHSGSSKIQNRFYGRNSAGKYPMDITEVRRSFVSSETLAEKISSFKTKRLLEIWSGTVWSFSLVEWGGFVLHIVPVNAFSGNSSFELTQDVIYLARDQLRPIGQNGYDYRINYEWYATYTWRNSGIYGYVQVFRNGIIEAVESWSLRGQWEDWKRLIPSIGYEMHLLRSFDRYSKFMVEVWISGPFSIHLSLLWAKGCELALDMMRFHNEYHQIDRELLETPDCIVNDFDSGPEAILRPMFDVIWNACWLPRSFNFDDNGNWNAQQNWRNS